MTVLLMYMPSPEHMKALERASPGAVIHIAWDEASAEEAIPDADAVLGNKFFARALPRAKKLKWMQAWTAGVDRILAAGGDRLKDVTITCVRGIYDDEVAEHAMALVLALCRGLHLARDGQHAGRWEPRPLKLLSGSHVLILGWGGIGRGIARRLAPFQVHVEGVRRSHRGRPSADEAGFHVRGPDSWRDVLRKTDVLVMALPLTGETRHVVGAAELAALPPHAFVVNVGRGGTLDDAALLSALREGRLGGAALDVLEEEPPPPDSPLRSEPKLLLTAHEARSVETPPYKWERLFVENLRRFTAGEKLLNVVDPVRGY